MTFLKGIRQEALQYALHLHAVITEFKIISTFIQNKINQISRRIFIYYLPQFQHDDLEGMSLPPSINLNFEITAIIT